MELSKNLKINIIISDEDCRCCDEDCGWRKVYDPFVKDISFECVFFDTVLNDNGQRCVDCILTFPPSKKNKC